LPTEGRRGRRSVGKRQAIGGWARDGTDNRPCRSLHCGHPARPSPVGEAPSRVGQRLSRSLFWLICKAVQVVRVCEISCLTLLACRSGHQVLDPVRGGHLDGEPRVEPGHGVAPRELPRDCHRFVVPKVPAVVLAGVVIIVAASTGSLRRFERTASALCIGSLIVIPLYVIVHPPAGEVARNVALRMYSASSIPFIARSGGRRPSTPCSPDS